jgi:hypothetical protein
MKAKDYPFKSIRSADGRRRQTTLAFDQCMAFYADLVGTAP